MSWEMAKARRLGGLWLSPPIAQLDLAYQQACVVYSASKALNASALVQCWGAVYDLVYGHVNQTKDFSGTADVTAISIGLNSLCTLRKNRTAVCRYSDPRYPEAATTWYDAGVTDVEYVSFSGVSVACAIVRHAASIASLWCWGDDGWGGVFSKSSNDWPPGPPWKVSGLPGNIKHVVVGDRHACVLVNAHDSRDDQVYCWGYNEFGQLGQGYTSGTPEKPGGSTAPLRVKGLSSVIALYGAFDSNCAVTAAQQVLCWGKNIT